MPASPGSMVGVECCWPFLGVRHCFFCFLVSIGDDASLEALRFLGSFMFGVVVGRGMSENEAARPKESRLL